MKTIHSYSGFDDDGPYVGVWGMDEEGKLHFQKIRFSVKVNKDG